jgi:murein peptide amidase A
MKGLIPAKERGRFTNQPSVYGQTVRQAPLEVWLPRNARPRSLILAGIHGDEPQTTVLLSAALRSIHSNDVRMPVILCANPDGLSRGTRSNAHGVDLNRNFPSQDWKAGSTYYRSTPRTERDVELSTGSRPASEPEVRDLIRIIHDLHPETIISLHAALGCIDDPRDSPLGRWLAASTRLPIVSDVGYETPGSLGTWGEELGIHVITYELPDETHSALYDTQLSTLITLLSADAPVE